MNPAAASETFSNDDYYPEYPASPVRILLLVAVALAGGYAVTEMLRDAQRPMAQAVLQAASAAVIAPSEARVVRILVEPGQLVTQGTPAVELADDKLESEIASVEQQLVTAQAALAQAEATAEIELAWRQKELQDELFHTRLKSAEYLRNKLACQIERLAWDDYLENRSELASLGTPDDVFSAISHQRDILGGEERVRALLRQDAAENSAQVHDVQIQLCDERLTELTRLGERLPERVRRSAGVDVAEAQVTRCRKTLDRLRERQAALVLTAPAYGTVAAVLKSPGEYVQVGEPVLSVVDQDKRFLTVEIPPRQVQSFAAGRELRLQFPGGEVRTGRVCELPPEAGATSENASGRLSVRVEPVGKAWPELPVGTAVDVATSLK